MFKVYCRVKKALVTTHLARTISVLSFFASLSSSYLALNVTAG